MEYLQDKMTINYNTDTQLTIREILGLMKENIFASMILFNM